MKIEIKLHSEKTIKSSDVRELYDELEWWPERKEEKLEKMLNNDIAIGAWCDGTLIGFCRAVSDGVFRAYVEDVAVLDKYRKKGIGYRLVEILMKELDHIDVVTLFCDEELVDFYKKHRFKRTTQKVMHRK
jgi:N-acetylglutamate synthase-like GNAT family acetyltransferase